MATPAVPDAASDPVASADTSPATPLATESATLATPVATPLQRPRWTLNEAAKRTGVSRTTLRRRLTAGAFPGATRDADGTWHVGVEDLLAAGLTLARPVVEDAGQVATPDAATEVATPVATPGQEGGHTRGHPDAGQVATLQRELEEERRRRLEAERDRDAERRDKQRVEAHLEDVRLALRALTAGPTPAPTAPAPVETVHVVDVREQPVETTADTPTSAAPEPAGRVGRVRRWLAGR